MPSSRGFIPALRRHLPELRDPLAEEPETRRYRLFEAVTRLLAFLARETPVVLILDDLQWADASTALLLGHLLQRPRADAAARGRHVPRAAATAPRSCPTLLAPLAPRARLRADLARRASTPTRPRR